MKLIRRKSPKPRCRHMSSIQIGEPYQLVEDGLWHVDAQCSNCKLVFTKLYVKKPGENEDADK